MNRKQFDAIVNASQRNVFAGVGTEADNRLAQIANTVAYLDQLPAAHVKAEAKSKGLKPADGSKFSAAYAIGVWAYERGVARQAARDAYDAAVKAYGDALDQPRADIPALRLAVSEAAHALDALAV